MPLHIEEFEDPELEETTYTYLLQDDDGKTLVNLSELMDGNLSEVEDYDDYLSGNTFDSNDYECQVLFNEKGQIIISPVIEYTHITGRNEFIVSVNGGNNDECRELTNSYDYDYYGVIDDSGDFILPPKYEYIEYDGEFDVYIINGKSYFLDGEYIGNVCDIDIDEHLVFKYNKLYGMLAKDGTYIEAQFDYIDDPYGNGILIAKQGNKAGLFNIKGGEKADLKFDDICEEELPGLLGKNIFKVKIGHQYGLIDEEQNLLFDNLMDGIDENSFVFHNYTNSEGKNIEYLSFIVWHNDFYWYCEINEDTVQNRKCHLHYSAQHGKPYDYMSLYSQSYQTEQGNVPIDIYIGYLHVRGSKAYEFRISKNNKYLNSDHTVYRHSQNNDFVILKLDDNLCGGFLIGKRQLLEHTSNTCVIPMNYNNLYVIKSKQATILGVIGELPGFFSIYEPVQFHQIGVSNTYEEAKNILKQYYSEIYK